MKLSIATCYMSTLFLVWAGTLYAGPVSLTDGDILRLRNLERSSPQSAPWVQSIESQAQEALGLTPNPISQIQTAGKLKGSGEKTQTEEALRDMPRLKALGLAYALTGREDYRFKAGAFITAWAKTCQPPENPIDATNLEPLLETYDLIRNQMDPGNRKLTDDWVRSVAQTLLASDNPSKGTHWNNWQAHRLKIVGLSAFLLGDSDLEKTVLENLRALLNKNLNPDGTTLDFLERDALHYQVYDLEPLIRTAILLQRAGNPDLYHWKTDRGASLSQCVAFVVPFAEGEKTHAEYVHTTVKFDIQRAQNNEKGHAIGADFPPQGALKCLELAQFFQPELKSVVGTLAGKPDADYPTLQVLLNEATRTLPSPTP
ncbi:MAG TPA: alginate lyase family protein [bacterium]|nr:alginate lyase family protein [bacterium]